MTPLTAKAALDRYFLETRCKLIEIAASLDRIDRGRESAAVHDDPRLKQIHAALALLVDAKTPATDRGERLQRLFSQEYEDGWAAPNAGTR